MLLQSQINIEEPGALLPYLRERGWLARGENPACQTLAGGVSNRTVLVRRENGVDWVLKQALKKLRVPVDWFSAPERIQREAVALRWLEKIIPGHAPQFLFEDQEQHILAMTAVPQPHQNWKSALLAGEAQVEHARAFGTLLARIHRASERQPALAAEFADWQFFEQLRLEPYYSYSAAQVPAASAFLRQLISETRARRYALVHGDYSPKNVLLHSGRLIILDYEVMHFGDAAFDIGFALTHFLSKAHYMRARRADFFGLAREFWRAYCQALGPAERDTGQPFAARHCLACCLARVAGRSPLELLAQNIPTIPQLIAAFAASLASKDGSAE